MTRINVITEGQTEETFVRDLLAPEFGRRNIFLTARSVETSRKNTTIYRGGLINYEKAKNDIIRWLKQDKASIVTTMFDFYALPDSFPGMNMANQKKSNIKTKIELLESKFKEDINFGDRFIPYIQLHEFEGLLFTNIEIINKTMRFSEGDKSPDLSSIINEFENPEMINDGKETAPSKRLLTLYPGYDKITNGITIAKKIGLLEIRKKCPHFNEWLEKIEGVL